ncbi:MAG: hypothetical protein ACE15F_24410, partial [bacterium]
MTTSHEVSSLRRLYTFDDFQSPIHRVSNFHDDETEDEDDEEGDGLNPLFIGSPISTCLIGNLH